MEREENGVRTVYSFLDDLGGGVFSSRFQRKKKSLIDAGLQHDCFHEPMYYQY